MAHINRISHGTAGFVTTLVLTCAFAILATALWNPRGPFDEARVRVLAGQQAQNFTEMTVQKARIDSEILQVLTADQKTKLASIRQKHEERMQNHQAGTPPEPPTD